MRSRASVGSRAGFVAAVVATSGFIGFVAFLPRLEAPQTQAPTGDDPAPVARPASSRRTEADTPTTITAPATSIPAQTAPPTTTTIPVGAASPFHIAPAPGEDAELTLAVAFDGEEGTEAGVIRDGDRIAWTLRVTNSGAEYLWGVFAYLELHGPLTCDSTRLAPGETTECTATTVAYAGSHTAWLWATAWTSTSILGTDLQQPFSVTA